MAIFQSTICSSKRIEGNRFHLWNDLQFYILWVARDRNPTKTSRGKKGNIIWYKQIVEEAEVSWLHGQLNSEMWPLFHFHLYSCLHVRVILSGQFFPRDENLSVGRARPNSCSLWSTRKMGHRHQVWIIKNLRRNSIWLSLGHKFILEPITVVKGMEHSEGSCWLSYLDLIVGILGEQFPMEKCADNGNTEQSIITPVSFYPVLPPSLPLHGLKSLQSHLFEK